MRKKNSELRQRMVGAGLRQWEVAEAFGLHEASFSRLLRKELDPVTKERIYNIIDSLKAHVG